MKTLNILLLISICISFVYSFTKVDTEKFSQQALDAHNRYRALHKAPPLQLDEKLSIMAQAIANLRVTDETYIANLPKYNNETVGSNVCQTIEDAPDSVGNGEQATNSWYSGVDDYKAGEENLNSRDFTQLVWRNTKLVGFGFAKSSPHGHYLAVALYYPPGNLKGEYLKNVFVSKN